MKNFLKNLFSDFNLVSDNFKSRYNEHQAKYKARKRIIDQIKTDNSKTFDDYVKSYLRVYGNQSASPPTYQIFIEILKETGLHDENKVDDFRVQIEHRKFMETLSVQGIEIYTTKDIDHSVLEDLLTADSNLPGRKDPLFVDALLVCINAKYASTSLLQRHLRIGYGRAAAMLDAMVQERFVGEMNETARTRKVLIASVAELKERISKAKEQEKNKSEKLKTKIEENNFYDASSYKYIKQFAKKYGEKGKTEDFNQLQILLKNWQFEFSVEELKILILEEYRWQKVENLKSKLLADNSHNRGTILQVYLNFYRSNDDINLKTLVELLEERFSTKEDISTLKTELQTIEKRIEIENFEKRLLQEDEQIQMEEIDNLNGYEFEEFLTNLYAKMGYQVEQTRLSGDQGADLVVIKFGEKTVIQAKRYGAKVGNYAVQEIMAAISLYKAQKGMVITNNYFTPAAVELANANNIELIDRDALEELINKHW